jgi:hypothetical protein
MRDTYFFDTYAIIEIMKGNPDYAKFKYAKIVITMFNLVELHYKLLRDFNMQIAEEVLHEYSDYVIDVDIETIKEANEFKLLHRKKRLSAPDAIGYITAQKYGMKFLTGDRQFKGMRGVEFVK